MNVKNIDKDLKIEPLIFTDPKYIVCFLEANWAIPCSDINEVKYILNNCYGNFIKILPVKTDVILNSLADVYEYELKENK